MRGVSTGGQNDRLNSTTKEVRTWRPGGGQQSSDRVVRGNQRGWRGAGIVLGSLVTALLMVGTASAAPMVTWTKPYTGSVPYVGSTVTWNIGTGTNHLIIAPTWTSATGVASYYGLAYSSAPPPAGGSQHGWDFLHAGATLSPFTCLAGPCTKGVHVVNIQWKVTWNSTEKTTCSGGWGAVTNNAVWTAGSVLNTSNNSNTGWSGNIYAFNSVVTTCPKTVTGGQVNTVYSYSFTGQFDPGYTYLLTTYWASEIYAAVTCSAGCGTGSGTALSDAQVNPATLMIATIT